MKTKPIKSILFLLVITTLFSCQENNDIPINENNLLLGNWMYDSYENQITTYRRVANLPEENYGFSFKTNGIYIERSSGWCGTPPLTFFDTEGNWQLEASILKIDTQGWQGNVHWEISLLTEEKLSIQRFYTEQEIEHQALMDLFNEFANLAYSSSCTNANNWSFTAYGSKACGGPQGYIAYSNDINTTLFLEKVAEYTKAENQYNIKWGIVSDCAVPPIPTGITCENGFPVLLY